MRSYNIHTTIILSLLFFSISKTSGKDDFDPSEKLSHSKMKLREEGLISALKDKKYLELDKPSSLLQATDESIKMDDLGITFPPEAANDTVTYDHHTYYNSTFYGDPDKAKVFWLDLDKLPDEKVITHEMLSDSHRQASTVDLSFDFPFYGNPLKSITVATGGFLYMGDYLHNWIAATQYVAPLMANFDTTVSDKSTIKYHDNGTAFTIQWDHVHIQDREKDGAFTFQVTLFQNGDIIFAYKEIPFPVAEISDDKHPVKIGISDAYILESSVFYVRRKTIYEYHRIDMMKKSIRNNTAIFFTALPTCLSHNDCTSCMADKDFECKWCEAVKRCSDGIDRKRQTWVMNGCSIQRQTVCPTSPSPSTSIVTMKESDIVTQTTYSIPDTKVFTEGPKRINIPDDDISHNYISDTESKNKGNPEVADRFTQEENNRNRGSVGTGVVIAIIVFASVILAVSLWIYYAYRYPQSSSGQFLIKYRPSQWNFKTESTSNADAFKM